MRHYLISSHLFNLIAKTPEKSEHAISLAKYLAEHLLVNRSDFLSKCGVNCFNEDGLIDYNAKKTDWSKYYSQQWKDKEHYK